MITRLSVPLLSLIVAFGLTASCKTTTSASSTNEGPPEPALDPAPQLSKIERGKYLVDTAGCHDCHTPTKMGPSGPEPDMNRALSGHPQQMVMPPAPKLPEGPWIVSVGATMTAWSGPWGTTFTRNLTPDGETGLGKWSEKNFIDTIRTGRRMGHGRPVLPPMPIPVVNKYTDEDLAAMFAYLQSIKPIKNKVPEPIAPGQLAVNTTTETKRVVASR